MYHHTCLYNRQHVKAPVCSLSDLKICSIITGTSEVNLNLKISKPAWNSNLNYLYSSTVSLSYCSLKAAFPLETLYGWLWYKLAHPYNMLMCWQLSLITPKGNFIAHGCTCQAYTVLSTTFWKPLEFSRGEQANCSR